ncbi:MAG: glycoside hydrolase, partial [Parafilimonas sp.]
ILLGLIRLNQAVYFWFQIESGYQSTILGSVILRPLLLGSWLMAWREWFELRQPKRMPEIIAILTVTYMAFQLFELLPVSKTLFQTHLAITDYIRPLFLILLVFITYQGMRKKGIKDLLVLIAIILVAIGLFPKEVSALHIIPGIWFPYGVGVSRGQFFYAAFVFVMYGILIQKTKELN